MRKVQKTSQTQKREDLNHVSARSQTESVEYFKQDHGSFRELTREETILWTKKQLEVLSGMMKEEYSSRLSIFQVISIIQHMLFERENISGPRIKCPTEEEKEKWLVEQLGSNRPLDVKGKLFLDFLTKNTGQI